MTEFISRKFGQDEFEVIIKTDSKENFKATEDFARKLIDHAKPPACRGGEMTDNEITEALECCKTLQDCYRCQYQPLSSKKQTVGCSCELMSDALKLINRLKAEIEGWEQRERILIYHVAVEREEAIKEFVEKIKATFPPRDSEKCTLDDCYTLDKIDEIARRLLKDGNNAE